jgi:2'-5' RNA ligase superfamily protein
LHSTIIGDFFDYGDLTDAVLARLERLAAAFGPFEYVAESVCAFPTSRALWLSPSPQGPFEKITEALYRAFPQFRSNRAFPTYHMTVAYNSEESASEELANRFLEEFKSEMPIKLVAEELAIYGEDDGNWAHLSSARFGNG